MNFDELIGTLPRRLLDPLPGVGAQKIMAPYETDQRRFDLRAREGARTGAVLILFYPENGEAAFPMIKRPKYNGTHSGQISLPGGKEEESDKDLIDTALRETNEEIGVDQTLVKIVGSLTELFIPVSNFRVTPFIGYVDQKPVFYPDKEEVEEVIEARLSAVLDESNRKIRDVTVGNGMRLKAPYFEVSDRIVWGATAMMLSELVILLRS